MNPRGRNNPFGQRDLNNQGFNNFQVPNNYRGESPNAQIPLQQQPNYLDSNYANKKNYMNENEFFNSQGYIPGFEGFDSSFKPKQQQGNLNNRDIFESNKYVDSLQPPSFKIGRENQGVRRKIEALGGIQNTIEKMQLSMTENDMRGNNMYSNNNNPSFLNQMMGDSNAFKMENNSFQRQNSAPKLPNMGTDPYYNQPGFPPQPQGRNFNNSNSPNGRMVNPGLNQMSLNWQTGSGGAGGFQPDNQQYYPPLAPNMNNGVVGGGNGMYPQSNLDQYGYSQKRMNPNQYNNMQPHNQSPYQRDLAYDQPQNFPFGGNY